MDLVKALSDQYLKPELPEINVGDTVRVSVKVKVNNFYSKQIIFYNFFTAKFLLSVLCYLHCF